VDGRTADLIDALRQPGAAILLELLAQSATEAHLLAQVDRTTQATANRRLRSLESVGLIQRERGKARAPGREWRVRHETEVAQLLRAAVALSAAVADQEARERRAVERKIRRSQARHSGLRDVSAER
jgi:DNA-binding HxlR family transcriptional regulator